MPLLDDKTYKKSFFPSQLFIDPKSSAFEIPDSFQSSAYFPSNFPTSFESTSSGSSSNQRALDWETYDNVKAETYDNLLQGRNQIFNNIMA